MSEAWRVVADTGGEKETKPSQLCWAPASALHALGEIYEFGGRKYTPTNYKKGYNWSLSANALMRHFLLWLDGESYDQESGKHHLLHAAWHCLTLFYFETKEKGKDDLERG